MTLEVNAVLSANDAQALSDQFITRAYFIYLPIVILLTAFVSYKLFKSGRVFMLDIFNGREDIAHSTNKLFELGFYLINIGFALKILYIGWIQNNKQLVENLSSKIGFFCLWLGFMMFLNLFLFFRGKKIASARRNEKILLQGLEGRE